MDFFDVLDRRRSTRRYESTPVEEEKLQRILEAVNMSPSAGDLQAYDVVVVRDEKTRFRLARACYGQSFVAEAPVSLVFLANPTRASRRYGGRGSSLYCIQDATIACAHAELAATALGLSCCWVGAFDDEAVAEVVDAPDGTVPVAVLPIGYADEAPARTPRRKLEDLVREL